MRFSVSMVFLAQLVLLTPVWGAESSPQNNVEIQAAVAKSNAEYRDEIIRRVQWQKLKPWIATVQSQIDSKFDVAARTQLGLKFANHNDTVVWILVDSDGKLKSSGIKVSCGSAETDRSALNAVRSVGNFCPPPNQLPCEQVETLVDFRGSDQKLEITACSSFPASWLKNLAGPNQTPIPDGE